MLRNEKVIVIGGDPGEEGSREVVVYELSVDQLPDALAVLAAVSGDKDRPQELAALAGAILEGTGEAARRLLSGATSLGEEIAAAGGLALLDVVEAWVEVNQPFFDRIGATAKKLAGVPEAAVAKSPEKQAA